MDQRIAERRRVVRVERRRGRLRRTILVVATLLATAAMIAVERSPLVGLEEVRVTGLERLDTAEVVEAADLDLGTSTLRLRLGAAAERVEELPLARSVTARRVDPLTVLIEVEERQPVLTVEGGGESVLVDRDGVVVAARSEDGLPSVGLDTAPPEPGERVAALPALANAYRAWRGLSGPLRSEVAHYEAAGADELTLVLRSGVEVRFGRADRVDEKTRALGAVLEDVGDGNVAMIDVRAPTAPVVIGEDG